MKITATGAARAYREVFTASLRSACFHRYGHFVINLNPPLGRVEKCDRLSLVIRRFAGPECCSSSGE
ncbi:hypothetical protein DVQ89_00805 [Yersinia enterocolitica]|nr:hypothetical protein [Yersinia enterocolitica]EKN6004322.1 hypothetical protein [Yersinia enterocolitica]